MAQNSAEFAKQFSRRVREFAHHEGVLLIEDLADHCEVEESQVLGARLRPILLPVSSSHPSDLIKRDLPELLSRLQRWIRLQKQYLIQFQALRLNPITTQLTFVTETFHDNLSSYIVKNPDCNRLQLLRDTLTGIYYLHKRGFIHGDVRGDNIFVKADSEHVRCYLGEFSPGRIPPPERLSSESEAWFAPELFDPDRISNALMDGWYNYSGEFTQFSDLYAFGCLMVQVYTGEPPLPKRFPPGAQSHRDLFKLEHKWTTKEKSCIPSIIYPSVGVLLRPSPKTRMTTENHLRALRDERPDLALDALRSVPSVFAKHQARKYMRSGLWGPLD